MGMRSSRNSQASLQVPHVRAGLEGLPNSEGAGWGVGSQGTTLRGCPFTRGKSWALYLEADAGVAKATATYALSALLLNPAQTFEIGPIVQAHATA